MPVFVCCYRHQLNDPCDTVQQELDMTEQPAAQLWRYDINMTDGTHRQRCLAERHFEFPSVPPALLGQLQTSPLHHHIHQDCDNCCLRAQLYSPTCPVSFSSLAAQQLFVLLVVSVCASDCANLFVVLLVVPLVVLVVCASGCAICCVSGCATCFSVCASGCATCCVIGCATCCVSSGASGCDTCCVSGCATCCVSGCASCYMSSLPLDCSCGQFHCYPNAVIAWRHSQHDFVRRVLHVVLHVALYQDARGSTVAVSGRCVCCEWMSQRSSLLL